MANTRQSRNLMPGLSLGPATALALAIVFVLTVGTNEAAQAQSLQVLHSFSGPDGAQPAAGLVFDTGGKLYGTVRTGHSGSNWGGAFQMRRAGTGWIFNTLYIFDGQISSRVVFGPQGLLYGSSPNNIAGLPYGYLYTLRPAINACTTALCSWNESLVYGFMGSSDGGTPRYGDLIFDQAGHMYGTASLGGNSNNDGVVFELTHSGNSWTEQAIYTFAGSPDGAKPYNAVVFDAAGNLYGTTTVGGASGNGTVFELSPSGGGWTEQVLYSFQGGADGNNPIAGLIFDGAGNLYGATANGGSGGGGTVFELSPSGSSWNYTPLYSLTASAANCGPWGTLTFDASGNLYGTTLCGGATGQGSVFKLTNAGGNWSYSSLHDFSAGSDGSLPYGNVIFDSTGDIYGTASFGGAHGAGTVWEITP